MLVTLIVGPPASGKTTEAKRLLAHQPTAVRLNRDERGGSLEALVPAMQAALRAGQDVILDNLFTTQMDRKPFIEQAKQLGAEVECIYLDLDIESCTINACMRMMKNHGRLLSPGEIKKSSNPNDIPPTVLFRFRKRFEMPSTSEGFSSVRCMQGYKHTFTGSNKAVILDYDGTLRETLGGGKFPIKTSQVRVLPGRTDILNAYMSMGYRLLGASNQSGVAKGTLTLDQAEACFKETNNQLGIFIDYQFCPHSIPPVSCYCRKPQSGMGIYFIEKYNLDPSKCIMVGDMTTDNTFATRLGIPYVPAATFFNVRNGQ